MGQQLFCRIRKESLLTAAITAAPRLACLVRVLRASKDGEERLEYKSLTVGQLLSVSVKTLAAIQCSVNALPEMRATVRKTSLLNCAVSAQPLLRASITRGSQLDGTIKAMPVLHLSVSSSPVISATISRPRAVNN
jgi:hypothetical protein